MLEILDNGFKMVIAADRVNILLANLNKVYSQTVCECFLNVCRAIVQNEHK